MSYAIVKPNKDEDYYVVMERSGPKLAEGNREEIKAYILDKERAVVTNPSSFIVYLEKEGVDNRLNYADLTGSSLRGFSQE